MRFQKWPGMLWALALLCLQAGLAQAAPENGWWWNPNQSGRGFSIEVQGNTLFMAGYLYENDGRAAWLVSTGPMQAPTTYQGRLLAFGNGQTLSGDYQAPAASTDAGAIALQFTDASHGTLTWPGGSIPIERFRYSSAAVAVFQPENGWWWNEAEGGRGFFIEIQGNRMFMAGYMYDANGKPLWYASDGTMASPANYQGDLYQFANGQTMTGPYKPPGAPTRVGAVRLDFSAPNLATMTLSDDQTPTAALAPGTMIVPKAGRSRIFSIKPFLKKVPTLDRPKFWKGNFTYIETYELGDKHIQFNVEGSVTFVMDEILPLDGSVNYQVLEGQTKTTFSLSGSNPVPPGGVCTITGHALERLFPSDGNLNLKSDNSYTGAIYTAVLVLVPDMTISNCPDPPINASASIFIDLNGAMTYLNMHGEQPDSGVPGGTTRKRTWNFDGLN